MRCHALPPATSQQSSLELSFLFDVYVSTLKLVPEPRSFIIPAAYGVGVNVMGYSGDECPKRSETAVISMPAASKCDPWV